MLEDFLWRHLREFCAAKQVRAEPPKMLTDEAAQFARRFLILKSNGQIAFCKPSIFPGTNPRASAKELAEREENRQRQRGDNGQSGAIKNVNDKIGHCRAGGILGMARQGRFACSLLQPI